MVSPTLTRKLFAVDVCWEKENQFSPVQCHRVCQLHSRTDPVPKQKELHGFVHELFLWFGFSNFCLIDSGLCVLIFLFESLCVCVFFFLLREIVKDEQREVGRIWENLGEGKT